MKKDPKTRCKWVGDDPISIDYHDNEWGVLSFDDRKHFEFLILEGAQAGLSWTTILKRRDGYRKAYKNFDPSIVAQFDARKVAEMMNDQGVIRNRLKIESSIKNAKVFLEIQAENRSFYDFIFGGITGGVPIDNAIARPADVPVTTDYSDKISKYLKKRGMSFVGSTIMYAYLQALGAVNDHETSCFRYQEINRMRRYV